MFVQSRFDKVCYNIFVDVNSIYKYIHTERKVSKIEKRLDIVGVGLNLNTVWGDNSTTRIGSAEHKARLAERAEYLKANR